MLYREIIVNCVKFGTHKLRGRNSKLRIRMLKLVVHIITSVFKVLILLFVVYNLLQNTNKLIMFVFVTCQSIPAVATTPQTAVPIKQRW